MSASTDARRLFESFLAANRDDLEALVSEHPHLAEELIGLYRTHTEARSRAARSPMDGSFFRSNREPMEESGQATIASPGMELGGFRLVRSIGSGGMGQVWEAEQTNLKRTVALKLVRPDRVNERTLELFAREARAGGRLSHPGIVEVHAHGTDEGLAWIAMELVEGCWTLRDFMDEALKDGELPRDYYREVATFVAALADALEAAHQSGVIHRDIKPQNILITPDELPKVTDFGLARLTDESALSQTGEVAGTYAYMSPEQVTARRSGLDHRSDVFSLGIVLYEMLSLQKPFVGDTAAQVGFQIMNADPPALRSLRSRIPQDLEVICGKCLEKDRDRRYASMAELALDLRRHLNSEPIEATPPGRLRKLSLWARRNPTRSVAMGIAAAAFVVISILLGEYLRANQDLAEQSKVLASEVASVKRLSAVSDLDELLALADGLFPTTDRIEDLSAWIRRAEELTTELPEHREKLADLRTLALERTPEEREADRSTHEAAPRFRQVEAELACREAALTRRMSGTPAATPELDWSKLPGDAVALNSLAWPMVDPGRTQRGREAEGLAIARRAVVLAETSADDLVMAQVLDTLSWALFAMGEDEEALEMIRLALERAPEAAKAEFEGYVARCEAAVAAASSPQGLEAEEQALGLLRGERARLSELIDTRRTFRFEETTPGREARWWHGNLEGLIESLERLEADGTGLLSGDTNAVSVEHGWSIPRRLAFAERLRDELSPTSTWTERWREAGELIRNQPAYSGLELERHEDLVPIGADPESGLVEFWHVATGEEPLRDGQGRLVVTEESGLVLVLVPGATFSMGSQAADPSGPGYHVAAEARDGPVHEVTVSPFFLSKYEMTQGQWLRFTGRNPSLYAPHVNAGGNQHDLRHPVEQVSWITCSTELERMGLALPSETQWEYACRAGTGTPWWTGEGQQSLSGAANLADRTAQLAGAPAGWIIEDWLEDGYVLHAPVGTFAPNPLGLHETIGNVWEWCLDGYETQLPGLSAGVDPLRPPTAQGNRVIRGGSFYNPAEIAYASRRMDFTPSFADAVVGVRPARSISPR